MAQAVKFPVSARTNALPAVWRATAAAGSAFIGEMAFVTSLHMRLTANFHPRWPFFNVQWKSDTYSSAWRIVCDSSVMP